MKKRLFIIIIALIIRLLLVVFLFNRGWSAPSASDPGQNMEIAHNIVSGKGYSMELAPSEHGLMLSKDTIRPTAWRVPGYPLFLAVIIKLGLPIWSVLIIQIIVDLMSLCIIFLLPLPRKICDIAAVLYALSPQNIYFTAQITAETFFTFFLLIGVYFILRIFSEKKDNIKKAILAGSFFGVASLFHPITLFLPLVISTAMIFMRYWRSALMIILFYACLISPWLIRNTLIFQLPCYTTNAVVQIAFFRAPTLYAPKGTQENMAIKKEFLQLYQEELKRQGRDNDSLEANCQIISELGLKWFWDGIVENPIRFIKASSISAARLMLLGHTDYSFLFGSSGLTPKIEKYGIWLGFLSWLREPYHWFGFLLDMIAVLQTVLGCIGFYAIIRRPFLRPIASMLGLIILYLILSTCLVGCPRYRTAFMPYLLILTAYGFKFLYEKAESRINPLKKVVVQ